MYIKTKSLNLNDKIQDLHLSRRTWL